MCQREIFLKSKRNASYLQEESKRLWTAASFPPSPRLAACVQCAEHRHVRPPRHGFSSSILCEMLYLFASL